MSLINKDLIRSLLAMFLSSLLILLAPAILTGIGKAFMLTGKLVGILYTGAPTLYAVLTATIAFLYGLLTFFNSKQ